MSNQAWIHFDYEAQIYEAYLFDGRAIKASYELRSLINWLNINGYKINPFYVKYGDLIKCYVGRNTGVGRTHEEARHDAINDLPASC